VALKKAKSDGKVDYVGITGHNPHVLEKAVRTGAFDNSEMEHVLYVLRNKEVDERPVS
jgi:predicted aldo/keto reductase-like oxidoreductase